MTPDDQATELAVIRAMHPRNTLYLRQLSSRGGDAVSEIA